MYVYIKILKFIKLRNRSVKNKQKLIYTYKVSVCTTVYVKQRQCWKSRLTNSTASERCLHCDSLLTKANFAFN